MNVIAVYPGRFHPFHKGHAASYNQLAKQFGQDNTYLAISQKEEMPDSPFSAQERALMAAALGLPKDKIISTRNPYGKDEYINQFATKNIDPEKTALVFAISGKDANRFKYNPKDYLQRYTSDTKLNPMTQNAYVMVTDVATFKMGGSDLKDASAIRKMYANIVDEKDKLNFLSDLYGNKIAKVLLPIFDKKISQVNEAQTGGHLTSFIARRANAMNAQTNMSESKKLEMMQKVQKIVEHFGTKEQKEQVNKIIENYSNLKTAPDYLPEK